MSLPVVVAKANRVDSGVARTIAEIAYAPLLAPIIVAMLSPALLALFGGMAQAIRRRCIVLCGVSLFALYLLYLGYAASALTPQDATSARVSPSWGFWLIAISGYIYIDTPLRKLRARPWTKTIIWLIPFGIVVFLIANGNYSDLAIILEYSNRRDRFAQELIGHISLSFAAVLTATIIGVPLGTLAWKNITFEKPIFVAVNGIQTIPSLALFGLLIAPLAALSQQFPFLRSIGIRGIGAAPAFIALSLYALLPIARNTYVSLASISESVIDAGRGVGMRRVDMLRYIEIPLAAPITLSGIRISAAQAIGNTTIAALIGARGLGNFVFQGLGQAAPDLIILGVAPIVILALLTDRVMAWIINYLTPRGLRHKMSAR